MTKTVRQMIAEIGEAEDGDFDQTGRPPHPNSLNGPLVGWCQMSADEQIRVIEDRRFERRLTAEVQARHKDGWPHDRLVRFANHHRARWAAERRRGPEALLFERLAS